MNTLGVRHSSDWRVTTAAQAAARDRAAIAAGKDSFSLMLNAGTAAASLVLRDYASHLYRGAAVFAGTGNNGGDAYIVAAQLVRAGIPVRLFAVGEPRTPDAERAAKLAYESSGLSAATGIADFLQLKNQSRWDSGELLVVDGVLGTGQRGPLHDNAHHACEAMQCYKARGATVVALDVVTGLDATSGRIAEGAVAADCTVCFGTAKRGVLLQRGVSGRVVVVDIGLGGYASRPGEIDDSAWNWHGAHRVREFLPEVAWNAHKGQRGRVLVAGGDMGMAGAVVHAANSALLSGAGVLHILAETQSIGAVQSSCPSALAHRWPALEGLMRPSDTSSVDRTTGQAQFAATPVGVMREDIDIDSLAVGPGLGRSRRSGRLLQYVMRTYQKKPMVIDADALWHIGDIAQALGTDPATLLSHWTRETQRGLDGAVMVVCTPHAGEFARLIGAEVPDDWEERGALVQQFALKAGVTVLLKGTPTLIASPGRALLSVVPHGTALLATGGSGDCLTGIIAVLLAQGVAAHEAAVAGATVHGYAAELAAENAASSDSVRGMNLEGVMEHLASAWRVIENARSTTAVPYVIAELRALS